MTRHEEMTMILKEHIANGIEQMEKGDVFYQVGILNLIERVI